MKTKHTREYAEKVCCSVSLKEYISSSDSFIKGYMKAIEETSAPDLLEALIKVRMDLKKHWSDSEWNEFDELAGVDNAIQKATL